MAGYAHGVPVVLLLEGDGGRNAQKGGGIVGSGPAKVVLKGRGTGRAAIPSPADDQGLQERLPFGACVEKTGPFGRAEPFMAVPGIKIGPHCIELQGNMAGCVRAIY